ncbi:hypothetical protein V8C44DRAFT_299519 [Trichoderma aethiopicum]
MAQHITMPTREFKQRRSHEKSRKGCTRCKIQRKKCDEARPICTRCKKRNHCCQYTFEDDCFRSESTETSTGRTALTLETPRLEYLSLPGTSPRSSAASSDEICLSDSGFFPASPYPASGVSQTLPQPFALSSEELELLSHYITHTSRSIPFDTDELYALHVGIPNLAFGSRPVMGSMLALSAVCKCYDIVRHSHAPLERLEEIKGLFVLADQHHRTSLHQIQAAIYDDHFDTLLANAPLMVLYALAGHCVRVLLAQMARKGGRALSNEMFPLQSQWITSIRAAYVAYVGVHNSPSPSSDFEDGIPTSPCAVKDDCPSHFAALSGGNLYPPEDGPSEGTRRLLLPIVSATYGAAMEKLTARAQTVWLEESNSKTPARDSCNPELQACLTSLKLLDELFTTIFANTPSSHELSPSASSLSGLQLNGLDKASPWLKRYLARVTSATPSKLWRRTIMAFLNRVPLDYLQLVQSALDQMPVATNQADSGCSDKAIPLGPAQQLALDIFSHWLVLVMLLDGVWWIGSIGQWELGRILSFTEAQCWTLEPTESGGSWWPESMYAVQKAIADPVE